MDARLGPSRPCTGACRGAEELRQQAGDLLPAGGAILDRSAAKGDRQGLGVSFCRCHLNT